MVPSAVVRRVCRSVTVPCTSESAVVCPPTVDCSASMSPSAFCTRSASCEMSDAWLEIAVFSAEMDCVCPETVVSSAETRCARAPGEESSMLLMRLDRPSSAPLARVSSLPMRSLRATSTPCARSISAASAVSSTLPASSFAAFWIAPFSSSVVCFRCCTSDRYGYSSLSSSLFGASMSARKLWSRVSLTLNMTLWTSSPIFTWSPSSVAGSYSDFVAVKGKYTSPLKAAYRSLQMPCVAYGLLSMVSIVPLSFPAV